MHIALEEQNLTHFLVFSRGVSCAICVGGWVVFYAPLQLLDGKRALGTFPSPCKVQVPFRFGPLLEIRLCSCYNSYQFHWLLVTKDVETAQTVEYS